MPTLTILQPAARRMAADAISYRPLIRDDLGAAAALFAAHLPGVAAERAPGALEDFLARELFDGPWVDPEAPSLVAEDGGGRLLGMIGRQVRPARLGDRELRLAWPEHLVVDPDGRTRAVGVQLLRRAFAGPYDATVADTASAVVEAVWTRLGGTRLDLKAVHWVRIFRPWSVAADVAGRRVARPRARKALARTAPVLDAGTVAAAGERALPPAPETTTEELTAAAWVEHRDAVIVTGALHIAYDEHSFAWVLAELGRVPSRGRPVAHLVRAPGGAVLGWYVYVLRAGGRSEVLQVAARPRHLAATVDHLLWHAAANGSAALRGRLEPGLLTVLGARRCLLLSRSGTLLHTRDPELLGAVHAEGALLTRLEGDWLNGAVV